MKHCGILNEIVNSGILRLNVFLLTFRLHIAIIYTLIPVINLLFTVTTL